MSKTSANGNPVRPRTMKCKPPAYRERFGKALVTLTDSHSGERRDYWLGPHGSRASHEAYARILAEWQSNGRRLPARPNRPQENGAITFSEMSLAYWKHAKSYYTEAALGHIAGVIRPARQFHGSLPAESFGPNCLRQIRQAMIDGDETATPPRRPWSRRYINSQVHRLCRVFRWAASHEMIPAGVYQQLKAVPALRRGRSEAHDPDPVEPVPLEHVEAVKPYLSRQVRALVDLQLLTGARGGELFKLRPIDIQMDDRSGIWTISLAEHKTAHHGHARTIYLGPRAQEVIRPFLADRPVDAFLFSPAEAEAERLAARHAARTTPLSCGNRPGTNRVESRCRPPGDRYTATTYRKAIAAACDQAFPPPEAMRPAVLPGGKRETKKAFKARLTDDEKEHLRRWRRDHRWHPHQLRHTAATQIRREYGLEAARIALGHSSALVTDACYAQRDQDRIREIMGNIG